MTIQEYRNVSLSASARPDGERGVTPPDPWGTADDNPTGSASTAWKKLLIMTAIGIGLIGLWLTSRVSYLLFHSLVEFFGFSGLGDIHRGLELPPVYSPQLLSVSGSGLSGGGRHRSPSPADLQGHGRVPRRNGRSADPVVDCRTVSGGGVLLLAPLFLTRRVRAMRLLSAYGLATALLLAAVFGGWFPACFVEGQGLTPFKIISEYLICVLLAGAIFFVYRRRQHLDQKVLRLVIAALGVSIVSELSFTLYVDVYGLFNQVGHFLKIIVLALLYKAIIETGLQRPYRTLFRELAQSEERYRKLFDTMTEGFALHEIICDDQGRPCDYRFLQVNPAFERLTGLKRKDLIGRRVLEVLPGTEPYWIETYGRVALDGAPAHFERFFPPLNRWYRVFAYRPHPGRFAVIFTDITERRQSEEALRRSQEQNRVLADLLEHSDQPFAVGQLNGALGYLNGAFERLTGFSREELQTIDYAQTLTPPEWHEAEAARLEELQRTGAPVRYEKEYIRKDGSRVPIELLVHLARDEQGRSLHYYSFITDLTERKRAEEALQSSRLAALNLMEDAVEARRQAEQISMELERASQRLQQDNREVALANRILRVFVEKTGDELFAPVLDMVLEEMASRHGVFGYISKPGHLTCPSLSTMMDECEIEGKCIHYPSEKWKGLWARGADRKTLLPVQPAPGTTPRSRAHPQQPGGPDPVPGRGHRVIQPGQQGDRLYRKTTGRCWRV